MSMNRNDNYTTNVIEDKDCLSGGPGRIVKSNNNNNNNNLSLKNLATVSLKKMMQQRGTENHQNEKYSNNKKRMDSDTVNKESQTQNTTCSAKTKKQQRILGLKRHGSPLSPSRRSSSEEEYEHHHDLPCYKTMHPTKMMNTSSNNNHNIANNGRKKTKQIQTELSLQHNMIKLQQQELPKKYQLLNSDLKHLLRSTADDGEEEENENEIEKDAIDDVLHPNNNSYNKNDNESPQRAVPSTA